MQPTCCGPTLLLARPRRQPSCSTVFNLLPVGRRACARRPQPRAGHLLPACFLPDALDERHAPLEPPGHYSPLLCSLPRPLPPWPKPPRPRRRAPPRTQPSPRPRKVPSSSASVFYALPKYLRDAGSPETPPSSSSSTYGRRRPRRRFATSGATPSPFRRPLHAP